MNPPKSFKFRIRFKINGICRMRAPLRASTFSRSIPAVFHRMRRMQSAQDRVASSGPGELLTDRAVYRRGPCGSFRCKTVSTASVRKGAMTRRRASRPLFPPCKTRSVEYRATVFLVALHTGKESVKGTLLPRLINIVVVRRQELD